MKKLFIYFGFINDFSSCSNDAIEITSRRDSEHTIDMKAFTTWCNEFGVSRLVPKTNEFTVLVGDREKIVQLNRY